MKARHAPWTHLFALLFGLTLLIGCTAVQGAPEPAPDPAAANALTASAAAVDFGTVVVGASQTLNATISNTSHHNITLQQATVSGAGFSLLSPQLPTILAAQKNLTFVLRFAPSAAGKPSGSLVISRSGSHRTITLALAGIAVMPGQLTVTPSSLTFGSVALGTNATRSATISNSGSSALTISQLRVNNAAFQLSGIAVPVTLAPGQSASFSVAFIPTAAETVSAVISAGASASLSSTASTTIPSVGRTASLALSGTGGVGQLAVAPQSVSFSSTQVGSSTTQSLTLSNSGTAPLQVSQAAVAGAGFAVSGMSAPITLQPGQSAPLSVVFSPTATGNAAATLTLASNAANPAVTISLAGAATAPPNPGAVKASSASLSFGSVQAGGSKSQSETLTNPGTTSVTVSQANLAGSAFSLSGLDLPLVLDAGKSLTFSVLFAPSAAGAASGSIALVSNATTPAPSIALSGTGAAPGQLTVSPASLSFGNVTVGSSQTQTVNLSAAGAGVTISAATVSTPDFTLSGFSLPLTLAAGQSIAVSVQFAPQSNGPASASASFGSNAQATAVTANFSGSGVAVPPPHSVGLAWSPSTSATGYFVYRGEATGGPYSKLNSSPSAVTAYADTSVLAGQTYFYVTTAVDQSGGESAYSNEVQAVIPEP